MTTTNLRLRFCHVAVALLLSLLPSSALAEPTDSLVRFETTHGNILVRLFNDTPIHRDNFLKLVREGFYDGLLFHRVIPDFMAQAGDPTSRNAPAGKALGEGDVGYTLPAEIAFPRHCHLRGALAAAREGDEVNPQFRSSGCQFYIVTGRKYNPYNFGKMRQTAETKTGIAYPDSVVEAYYDHGGTPWLDGTYTVFGEVLEGIEHVEDITYVERDTADRPIYDVRIVRATIVRQ